MVLINVKHCTIDIKGDLKIITLLKIHDSSNNKFISNNIKVNKLILTNTYSKFYEILNIPCMYTINHLVIDLSDIIYVDYDSKNIMNKQFENLAFFNLIIRENLCHNTLLFLNQFIKFNPFKAISMLNINIMSNQINIKLESIQNYNKTIII